MQRHARCGRERRRGLRARSGDRQHGGERQREQSVHRSHRRRAQHLVPGHRLPGRERRSDARPPGGQRRTDEDVRAPCRQPRRRRRSGGRRGLHRPGPAGDRPPSGPRVRHRRVRAGTAPRHHRRGDGRDDRWRDTPGTVTPNLRATTYRFEYGTSTAYGGLTPLRNLAAGGKRRAGQRRDLRPGRRDDLPLPAGRDQCRRHEPRPPMRRSARLRARGRAAAGLAARRRDWRQRRRRLAAAARAATVQRPAGWPPRCAPRRSRSTRAAGARPALSARARRGSPPQLATVRARRRAGHRVARSAGAPCGHALRRAHRAQPHRARLHPPDRRRDVSPSGTLPSREAGASRAGSARARSRPGDTGRASWRRMLPGTGRRHACCPSGSSRAEDRRGRRVSARIPGLTHEGRARVGCFKRGWTPQCSGLLESPAG